MQGHVSMRVAIGVTAALMLVMLAEGERPVRAQAAKPGASVCDIQTTERVVAVGDIHGAFDNFVAILRAAQIIDNRDRWSGRRAILVQTGDILDRGPDSRKAIDLLRRLERDAQRAGGRVVSLLGNHELMRVISDWRYVSAGEIDAFRNGDSAQFREQVLATLDAQAAQRAKAEGRAHDAAAYREQFLKEVPLGMIELRQAFGPQGEYGKWIRERPAVARINGVLFLHGGISPETAPLGCDGINAAIAKELAALPPPEQAASLMSASETGPLWYRGLALQTEEEVAPILRPILEQMKARAIVVGHSTVLPGRIVARLDGRVILIDTGMVAGEFYKGGVPSALEWSGGTLTAIYLDRREPLPAPALQSSTPSATR
ncbi:MAG TPA: metallophosphoesterase [Vicinamibacterales bacterium]|nr:metallophosphoesterase [Vicinamibacterales bacterium]